MTEKKHRQSPMKFSDLGIVPGEILTFVGDPSIQVKVLDDRKVEYDGKAVYLAPLTKELRHAVSYQVPGSWWTYHGVKLSRIRDENKTKDAFPIGASVVHKKFGKGKVIDLQNEQYMTVRFADKDRRFLYPMAFDQGYLATEHDCS